MRRQPFFENFWQEMSNSKTLLLFSFFFGAFSLYCFLRRLAFRADRRAPPGINSKDSELCLLEKMRQKKFKGSRVCIAWEVLTEDGQWLSQARDVLLTYASDMEVYLMCYIHNEEDKKNILTMLKGIEGLVRHRILFCKTLKGYDAFCRQIKPTIVIMNNERLALFLATVLPYVVLVGTGFLPSSVTCIESIHELLPESDT